MHRSRWLIFGLCASVFILSMFYRASTAIIAPDLGRELSLDYSQLGLMGAVFFYTFALVQLPLGLVLDRVGPRLTVFGLNLIGCAGALVFSGSSGPAGAVAGRALLGLGMASNLIGPLSLLARWFPARRFATVQGLFMAVGTTGGLLATSPLALLVGVFGWRGSFRLLAAINLLLALIILVFIRNRPPEQRQEPAPAAAPAVWSSLRILMGSKDYWLISWSAFFRYGAYASIQTLWAGPYLIEQVGLSPLQAGQVLLLMNAAYIMGSPATGWLADSLLRSRKWTVVTGMGLMACSILVLGMWDRGISFGGLALIFITMGLTNSSGNVMYSHIKNLMPPEMVGTALAGVNFFTMAGAGVFVHAMGSILASLTGNGLPGEAYRTTFLLCAGAMGLVVVMYLQTRDDRI